MFCMPGMVHPIVLVHVLLSYTRVYTRSIPTVVPTLQYQEPYSYSLSEPAPLRPAPPACKYEYPLTDTYTTRRHYQGISIYNCLLLFLFTPGRRWVEKPLPHSFEPRFESSQRPGFTERRLALGVGTQSRQDPTESRVADQG